MTPIELRELFIKVVVTLGNRRDVIVIVIMTAIDKFFANGMMLLLSLFDDVFFILR